VRKRPSVAEERVVAREFLDVEATHAHDCERFVHEFAFSRRIGFAPNDPVQTEHHVVAHRHLRENHTSPGDFWRAILSYLTDWCIRSSAAN
jgi:hypothetical protein